MNSLSVSVLSLNQEALSEEKVAAYIATAASTQSKLIVIPFDSIAGSPSEQKTFYQKQAIKHSTHLVAGIKEENTREAIVYSPTGEFLGNYTQTHRLPDEQIQTGNQIQPIQTPLGSLGLSIGSDLYFPEVHWSLAQQGADILIHLDFPRSTSDHFYSILSPRVRASDTHKPLLVARSTSDRLKLVHNEEFGISGTPMPGSVIIDQNGAILASSGYSEGIARADLRFQQRSHANGQAGNILLSRGNDIWKLYYNDSRKYFTPLCKAYAPRTKPSFSKRKIRIAVLSHYYSVQLGESEEFMRLFDEACGKNPDIIVTTEMESKCRPDDEVIARTLESMVEKTKRAGAYLLVGGVRKTTAKSKGTTSSHGILWDRQGNLVFESAIMLYGKGLGQTTVDTDFGRVGIRLCGDIYAPELDRLFAMEDADIVLNPSMAWGACGMIHTELNQVRAMDNMQYVVSAHLSFSDPGQRSHVIDPTGGVISASQYYSNSVLITDIDLDSKRGIFVTSGTGSPVEPGCYLEQYRSSQTHRLLSRKELFQCRRPELYKDLDFDRPDHPYTTRDRGDGVRL